MTNARNFLCVHRYYSTPQLTPLCVDRCHQRSSCCYTLCCAASVHTVPAVEGVAVVMVEAAVEVEVKEEPESMPAEYH